MSEEIQQTNPNWYKDLQYKDVKIYIKDNINSASRSFVAIGYYLKYVRDNELFSEDGYSSIWEFAQGEFGFSQSWASRYMSINDRFSKDGNSPILIDKYVGFDKSKLSEMLTLTDQQLEQVTIATTVAEIKDLKRSEKAYATSHREPECFIKKDLPGELMCSGGISDNCNTCDRYDPVETEPDEPKLIDDLDFTVRTYNCLKRAGIDTIDELCELTRDDVIGIRNISHKCLDEIYMKLSGIGRCLKEEIRNESIDSEPEDNDDKIPDPDLSCKFDLEARCLIASKESCKRSSDEGCMNCSGSWGEEDYVAAEPKQIETDLPCDTCGWDIKGCCDYDNEDMHCINGDSWKPKEADPVEIVVADIIQTDLEPIKIIQPELPLLKNNDQRKDFIDAYETWPIWIDIKETGERYYRYDFDSGDSMVVKVYYCKVFDYKSTNLTYEERFRDDWGKEEYYLLEPDKYFKDCETNKSALVDYLKEIQKKGAN